MMSDSLADLRKLLALADNDIEAARGAFKRRMVELTDRRRNILNQITAVVARRDLDLETGDVLEVEFKTERQDKWRMRISSFVVDPDACEGMGEVTSILGHFITKRGNRGRRREVFPNRPDLYHFEKVELEDD